mmetsp:Transcript_58152/g.180675  ORF Transcript_58152/g.180675 Transcript_58152/m.180675 type:complete len:338 (+) Transcript_58152:67-1080(+)
MMESHEREPLPADADRRGAEALRARRPLASAHRRRKARRDWWSGAGSALVVTQGMCGTSDDAVRAIEAARPPRLRATDAGQTPAAALADAKSMCRTEPQGGRRCRASAPSGPSLLSLRRCSETLADCPRRACGRWRGGRALHQEADAGAIQRACDRRQLRAASDPHSGMQVIIHFRLLAVAEATHQQWLREVVGCMCLAVRLLAIVLALQTYSLAVAARAVDALLGSVVEAVSTAAGVAVLFSRVVADQCARGVASIRRGPRMLAAAILAGGTTRCLLNDAGTLCYLLPRDRGELRATSRGWHSLLVVAHPEPRGGETAWSSTGSATSFFPWISTYT